MLRLNNAIIEDTYAELFNMWVGRVIITAENEKWCGIAAEVATGYASSIIGSPAEAGIEGDISPDETPDGRVGKIIQIYHHSRSELKKQMIGRIGQCIMTCPTTAAFDGLPKASRRLKVGRSLRLFGDGFQERDELSGRKVWRIPVMEGEFIVEDSFGAVKGVAGGNFLIFSRTLRGGLEAAEKAVEAIKKDVKYVILPFPGGVCRSGSKVGSIKYKLPASTNHPFCPSLRGKIPESRVPDDVNCIYEIVINGLDLESVKEAMRRGIRAAVEIPDVVRISAGNYGGKIGPMKIFLHEILK
ncbi:MAG TPA: formylmethanofuran--tetrahydromethanopterin N-formyltransferase [Candidatus Bathyarchaeota archaeon]|nr:formylmethanofuran--tetrahydromethanopterin N-formyltransferase [Candidatus Bathyarchaeota archaeon]